MKLHDILQKYQDSVLMREAVRRQRTRAILESKVPQSGAYWWLPTPKGRWTMEVFYDSEFNNATPHDEIWRIYVVERLATLWGKDPDRLRRSIADNYAGLPRGRVNKLRDSWTIVHGNDAPKGTRGVEGVINAFSLRAVITADEDAVKVYEDEHEKMMPGDPEAVQRALGVDLGLKGEFAMDFDWD